jgi:predicted  nucleic acid-binding Zn-ribbon protein
MSESARLLELQAIDVDILRATKRLDELPEKRAILETRAKQREVGSMREKAQMLVTKLDSEIKARQDEISMLSEKIAAEQVKVMETSDHRAVQSITREMDGLKRRVDKLEMETLQYMERAEKARAQVATIDDALAKIAVRESELIERFRAVGGAVQDEIAALSARRTATAAQISPALLTRYDQAREAKGGVGVGRLVDGACTACRMGLPAARVSELLSGPDVGVCPECKRLIVVRGGDDE